MQTLGYTGTYTLLLEGYVGNGASPITYGFNVQKVTNTSAAITLGATVNGAVAQVGQQNNYTFSLTSDTQVYFDSLTNTGLTWYLYGPLGNVVSNRSLSGSDGGQFGGGNLLLALVAGDYTLIVDGSGDGTASYSFRLLDLSTATAITPGTPVSTNLTPGNETDLYKFDVVAGEQFYFDRLSQSGGTIYWRLIDPFGRQHFYSGFDDVDVQTLGYTGAYTIIVEGYVGNGASPITYGFNVQKVTNTSAAITLGATVNGAVAQVGQQNNYTFSLTSDTQVYFDSLTNTGLTWYLYGPLGNVVSNRSLSGSDGGQFGSGNLLLALVAGRLHADRRWLRRRHRQLQFPAARSVDRDNDRSGDAGIDEPDAGQRDRPLQVRCRRGRAVLFRPDQPERRDDLLAADRSARPAALLRRVR